MRADLHGPDPSEALDAARRAQNAGQECENDNEEEGEEEELGLMQAHLATHSNTCERISLDGALQTQIPSKDSNVMSCQIQMHNKARKFKCVEACK